MVDMAAIAGAASALKTAYDLSKAALSAHDAAVVRAKITEMQGEISSALASAISAQTDQLAMLDQVRDLEKEVANFKSWDAEKQRYELKRYDPGTFFYTLKVEEAHGEPIHHLCARCYKNAKPSIIQKTGNMMAREPAHFCPECKTQFYVYRNPASAAANL